MPMIAIGSSSEEGWLRGGEPSAIEDIAASEDVLPPLLAESARGICETSGRLVGNVVTGGGEVIDSLLCIGLNGDGTDAV
jgi:hypothetical protein